MSNLSISMLIDNSNTEDNLLKNIPSQTPSIWIPDNHVSSCYNCNTTFSMLNRKHHCRICGRIFCKSCIEWYSDILPSYVLYAQNFNFTYDEKYKKMCEECCNKVSEMTTFKNLITIFSSVPITINELLNLRSICKEWKKSIEYVIGIYRQIQYKCSYQKWNSIEKKILKVHYKEFSGHSCLMTKCLIGLADDNNINHIINTYIRNKKTVKCKKLLCTRKCKSCLSLFDLIEILNNKNIINHNIISLVGFIWKESKLNMLLTYLPFWLNVSYNINTKLLIQNYLFTIILKDYNSIYKLYYELKLTDKHNLLNDLWDQIPNKIKIEINKTDELVECITKYDKTMNNNIFINLFKKYSEISLPWNYNKKIIYVDVDNIKRLNSFTKPLSIPILIYHSNRRYRINILYKKEDIRKDKFVMITIKSMQYICKNLDFVVYDVYCIDNESGIIEMIDNTVTLFDLKKNKITLQNYILNNNINTSIHELRMKFMKSCVTCSLICHVLGVGDRHLENILVRKDGVLCHIDYNYLLGTDPKFSNSEIRITSEMLEMLGGNNSIYYNLFKTTFTESYEKLRKYSSFWYVIFQYLINISEYNLSDIQNHITNKLVPGEFDCNANLKIEDIVNNNSNTWKHNISDFTHSISNYISEKINYGIFNMEL